MDKPAYKMSGISSPHFPSPLYLFCFFLLFMSSSANPYIVHLGFRKSLKRPSPAVRISTLTAPLSSPFASFFKISGSEIQRHGCKRWHDLFRIAAMDDDLTTFDEFDDNEGISGGRISSILSASEGEESDTEIFIIPTTDADLPHSAEVFDKTNAVSVATHRFATLRGRHRKGRIQPGFFINMGLIAFSALLLLLIDWCSWKIVRLPLPTFYLTRPFTISALLASFAGFLYIPIVDGLKIRQILRKEGPTAHASKNGTPTMGGLYFVPIGITVARTIAGFSSIEVHGAATATIAFAAIGLLDDTLSFIRKHNYGLPAQYKLYLQLAVGTWFSFWLDSADVTARYGMKMLVPLPEPLGLVYFGKFYLVFSAFCFVAMGNGVNLTDGLDGLAGGTAALAFIGMSIAVLPICSELAIFGASMAGACVGFLMHNGYKASIFMGDIGSLALGGALAAMASCTGMFFPLLIVSSVFALEVISVIMQVSFFKVTRRLHGAGRRLFRMSPLHHHLELCGVKEPYIVTGAYVISSLLALLAGYVGLISV